MTARILGEMSGTLLAMFWTWRNLNEFSTMTVKEVAKVLTQGQDKLITVLAKEVISVQIYEKSAVAGGSKRPGFSLDI